MNMELFLTEQISKSAVVHYSGDNHQNSRQNTDQKIDKQIKAIENGKAIEALISAVCKIYHDQGITAKGTQYGNEHSRRSKRIPITFFHSAFLSSAHRLFH